MTEPKIFPLNQKEMEVLAEALQLFKGGRLQGVVVQLPKVILSFQISHEMVNLIFHADKNLPLLYWEKSIGKKKKGPPKPLSLFLQSHFVGKTVLDVVVQRDWGRVLQFSFDGGEIQFCLIPTMPNILILTEEKSLSLFKPEKIERLTEEKLSELSKLPARTAPEIFSQIQALKSAQAESPTQSKSPSQKNTPFIKLERALKKVHEEILAKLDNPWAMLGEKIKERGLQSLSIEERKLLKGISKPGEAMNFCFTQSKKNKQKLEGVRKREAELQTQIADLKLHPMASPEKPIAKRVSLLHQVEGRGRTFHGEGFDLYVGRSGQDNLSLLRKSRAWDYWVHLKDFPGAHGIIRREKSRTLSSYEWQKVFNKLCEFSFSSEKLQKMRGEKLNMICTETRFVKPIKGDRLGRVTYKEETSFLLTL